MKIIHVQKRHFGHMRVELEDDSWVIVTREYIAKHGEPKPLDEWTGSGHANGEANKSHLAPGKARFKQFLKKLGL